MKNQLTLLALSAALLAVGCSEKATTPPVDSGPFPILVSKNWVPSGYMGDISGISVTFTSGSCPTRASTSILSDCYKVVFTPQNQGWGGVFWLYPANNWGSLGAGKAVPAGATKVTFFAYAETDKQVVSFQAGGVNFDGTQGAYRDSLKAATDFQLTTAWKQYSIDLTGQPSYSTVIGGFEFSVNTAATFYLDDIKWTK